MFGRCGSDAVAVYWDKVKSNMEFDGVLLIVCLYVCMFVCMKVCMYVFFNTPFQDPIWG